jgi:hypothetical protein
MLMKEGTEAAHAMLEELAKRGATPADLETARKELERWDLRAVTDRDWRTMLEMQRVVKQEEWDLRSGTRRVVEFRPALLQEAIVRTIAAAQGRAFGEADAKGGPGEGSAKTNAEIETEGRRRGFEGEALRWFAMDYLEAFMDAGFDPEDLGAEPTEP